MGGERLGDKKRGRSKKGPLNEGEPANRRELTPLKVSKGCRKAALQEYGSKKA